MAEQIASHEEVWDDSELVDSWNQAFEEYKKYHSLAVKGEKVKIEPVKPLVNGDTPLSATSKAPSVPAKTATLQTASVEGQDSPAAAEARKATTSLPSVPAIPQLLMGTAPSEDLKNLMMSWYYAGYYTGLYEGKQQGYAAAQQQGG